jgi:hypothetical protein
VHVQRLREVLAAVKALCQALKQDVRLAICEAVLAPLARAAGPHLATEALLKEAVELIEVRTPLWPLAVWLAVVRARDIACVALGPRERSDLFWSMCRLTMMRLCDSNPHRAFCT